MARCSVSSCRELGGLPIRYMMMTSQQCSRFAEDKRINQHAPRLLLNKTVAVDALSAHFCVLHSTHEIETLMDEVDGLSAGLVLKHASAAGCAILPVPALQKSFAPFTLWPCIAENNR